MNDDTNTIESIAESFKAPAVDLSNFSVATLASSSLVLNLSISVWTGRKLDKRVSEEIDQTKSTRTRGGNYHKNLLPDGKLAAITKVANAARAYVYGVTQPWGDNGDRNLSVLRLPQCQDKLETYEKQFAALVNEFLNDYDTQVAAAAFQLGDLFNRDDYPSRDRVASKFGFRWAMTPMPQTGDFRVDVGNEGLRQLQDQYENVLKQRVTGAMTDAWERLHSVLTHMSERLSDRVDEEGNSKRKTFRDSLVDNAQEVCELLKVFNITNDTRMDEMRRLLERAIVDMDAQTLRESEGTRMLTKHKVDAILNKFSI